MAALAGENDKLKQARLTDLEEIAKWKKEMLPGLRDADRPFTVGYDIFLITHLPARDGVAHGNVKRSAELFLRDLTQRK